MDCGGEPNRWCIAENGILQHLLFALLKPNHTLCSMGPVWKMPVKFENHATGVATRFVAMKRSPLSNVVEIVAVKASRINKDQQRSPSSPQQFQQQSLRNRNIQQISIDRGIWFGTRGSEVQILSPRPILSSTYVFRLGTGFPIGFPFGAAELKRQAFKLSGFFFFGLGSPNTTETAPVTASVRSSHHDLP